ncbi:MtrB/PioB family outer membrane beta-barrel protein [Horticoccus sp. 23ND18S-11]|uniref:MtrB/PioB family outer membrane beta-barrel protein n=1 Tax=Horticoccus sp. 23ND18S-11 TaxID=3391832 RepID=UPI0039C98A1E
MKTSSRFPLRTLASCLGATLVPLASAAPLADSAVGVGTVLGNAMNPAPSKSRAQDPDWATAKHSPTGQMYKLPFAVPKLEDIKKTASGWEYSGQIEVGVIGGDADERNAQFTMYQDIDNGAYVNNFNLQMKKPEGGYMVELSGGGAGRHDQYYGLQFGRYNDWKVKVYFSETPHVFTDRYKTLWTGIGTDVLTLLPGLTPGGTASIPNDNASVAAAAAANANTMLSLTRKRSGVRIDANLTKTWKGYVSYALEKRTGARPFAAVWGNNGGTAPIEIAEPVDYDTQDIHAGVMHADGLNAFNLRLSASRFKNNLDTLTFQEPYRITPAAGVTTVPAAGAYTQGRFDLYPSNDSYNIRAEYTRSMPDFHKSYLTAVVSAGTWRQDDNLIPYAVTPNVTQANVTLLPGGAWDTVGSLSRKSTDARVDTRLADLTFSANPTAALNVKAKARYYETDNSTDPFLAVNPNAVYLDADATTAGNQTRGLTLDGVTGVWGRPLNDGSGQSILLGTNATPAGNVAIKSTPYGSKQFKFGPSADYRLNKVSNLNAAYERDTVKREHRERDRTWEDKIKVGYVNRGLWNSSLRLSYEYAKRRGDDYTSSTYDEYFSPAIFPIPTTAGTNVTSWAVRTNSGFRSLDVADRDQHVVNLRLDTMVRPNLDAGISLQGREAEYPHSTYGLTGQSQRSANLDLNYQPSPRQTIYGFYSYQLGRNHQASVASGNGNVTIGAATALGTITAANAIAIGSATGGPVFPALNDWTADSTDHNHLIGAGIKQDIGKASLNVDYTYSTGRTRINYAYTVGGALNAANAALARNRMPDLATDVNYLDASLRFPFTDRLSARLIYRYQKETIRDWHYQNLEGTPVVLGNNGAAALPTSIQLDGGPHDYKVNWYGVMFQIKL